MSVNLCWTCGEIDGHNATCPVVASDCSGAEAGQSDAERSGDPSRSGDSRFMIPINAHFIPDSEGGHIEYQGQRFHVRRESESANTDS